MNVSITKVKAFKACRRLYQLRYVEGLKPVQKPEALETGSRYHELIDGLYKTGELAENDFSKEHAMARAYKRFIYYEHYNVMKSVESEVKLDLVFRSDDVLVGVADGLTSDGCILEHKTTSAEITEAYEYNLLWDEQILAYMLLTGRRKVYYTVCRKPTIRQKKDETDEAFYYRMLDWYETDTDSKIRLLEIERTDEEVRQFERNLQRIIADMKSAETDGDFYCNTCHCNQWGRRCEYSSVCLHYDPSQEYIEFTKGN